MTTFSKLLLASVMTLSFSAPVLAQQAMPEGMALEERNVYYFAPGGKMIRMKATDAQHAMAMKELKPMAAGTIIYASGGKLYTAQDIKMASGKMLSAEFFGTRASDIQ